MTASVVQAALSLTGRLDLAIVGKVTIILAFGLTALPLASRARASVRHLLMAATFATVFVLPLAIRSTVPAVTIQVPVAAAQRIASVASNGTLEALVPATSAVLGDDTSSGVNRFLASFAMLLRSLWAAGAVLLLVLLAIDLLRLRALRRRGLPWPAQTDLIRSLALTSGVRRSVDVLLHEGISAPLTCGLWRPAILLPMDASDWHEANLRRALVHELEHVRRGDWATQLVARVVCACYWFHPLVWMAWGRLRLEAERACDDAVVQSAESTEYAEQLVSLARRLSAAHALPSLAMANRTDLSARVGALLDGSRQRGPVGVAMTVSVVSVACLLVLLITSVRAIAAPIASPEATHNAQPARDGVVASRLRDGGVNARDTVEPQIARAKPKRSTNQRVRRPVGELATGSHDSTGNAQSTHSVIDGPMGNSGIALGTLSHSSTTSGTATQSASASSSGSASSSSDSPRR
jgi:beta-lactamase regulating signal transducer with metallopeptidase domain